MLGYGMHWLLLKLLLIDVGGEDDWWLFSLALGSHYEIRVFLGQNSFFRLLCYAHGTVNCFFLPNDRLGVVFGFLSLLLFGRCAFLLALWALWLARMARAVRLASSASFGTLSFRSTSALVLVLVWLIAGLVRCVVLADCSFRDMTIEVRPHHEYKWNEEHPATDSRHGWWLNRERSRSCKTSNCAKSSQYSGWPWSVEQIEPGCVRYR